MSELPNFIANHPVLIGALILIVVLLVRNMLVGALPGVTAMPPDRVVLLINHEAAQVLDVRSREAYERGHIRGARHGLQDAELAVEHWVIICGEGSEALQTVKTLQTRGHTRLACLRGGLTAWTEANLPLEKSA